MFKDICREADVPVQTFVNRSDMAGGSTLGNFSKYPGSVKYRGHPTAAACHAFPVRNIRHKDTAYTDQSGSGIFSLRPYILPYFCFYCCISLCSNLCSFPFKIPSYTVATIGFSLDNLICAVLSICIHAFHSRLLRPRSDRHGLSASSGTASSHAMTSTKSYCTSPAFILSRTSEAHCRPFTTARSAPLCRPTALSLL